MNVPGFSLDDYGRKRGVAITFGLVLLAVLADQVFIGYMFVDAEMLLFGPVLLLLWAAVGVPFTFVAGAIGGGSARRNEPPEGSPGAKIGAWVGAVGNLGAALVGLLLASAITLVFFAVGILPPDSPPLQTLLVTILGGLFGVLSGTLVAGIGGAVGALLASWVSN